MFAGMSLKWSEWRDLNSRPPDPKSGVLPTELHPDINKTTYM